MTQIAQIAQIDAKRRVARRAQSAASANSEREPGRELSLVPPLAAGARAQQLFLEARAVSLEHLQTLQASLDETRELAQAVVDAGDVYGAGLQDFTRRFAEELFWRGKTLAAFSQRQRASVTGGPQP